MILDNCLYSCISVKKPEDVHAGGLRAVLAHWGVGKLRTRRKGEGVVDGQGGYFLRHTGRCLVSKLDGPFEHPDR